MMRSIVFALSALVTAVLLMRALVGIAPFGHYAGPYGDVVTTQVLARHDTPQAVSAVTFDIRGFDTLGEEFILFTAVAGSLLLIRREQEEQEHMPQDRERGRPVVPVNHAMRITGMLLFPLTFILGISMILHGHLTPGGGFQGGVLVASAFCFIYLCGEYEELASFLPDHLLDLLEALGAVAFVVVALVPLARSRAVMTNLLPGGTFGELVSAGTLPLFNSAVGMEVAAAFLLLIVSFLKQTLMIRRRGRR